MPGHSTRQRSKRKSRRAASWYRVCETIAAVLPAVLLLVHLTLRSATTQPEAWPARATVGATEDADLQPGRELTVVPEPNCLALFGVGAGWVFYQRRAATRRCFGLPVEAAT